MDRSKWEYKKLGEVCLDFVVPQRDKPTAFDGDIPWCRIEDIEGRYLNGSKSGQNVTKELADRMNMHICPKGTVISACSASIGNQAITTVDCYTNQTFIGLVVNPELLYNEYLYYFLESKSNDLQKMGQGATIKYISKDKYKKMLIPLPSVSDQQRIVAELDCLNEMITVKQEQLKEFDTLAQSIFYDMFGDPVANDKKWDMVPLEIIATLINGRAYKQNELLSEGKYKIIRVGNFFSNNDYYYSDLELEDNKYCDSGDLLYTWSASFGARIWDGGKVIYHYHIWKIDYRADKVDKLYLCYLLNLLTERFKEDVHGVTMVHLTKAGMEKNPVILPPLTLQQQFAEKISAIEAQKELVKQSIAETQALLSYTMDKYFG